MVFFLYKLNPTKFLLFLVSKKKESLERMRERDFYVIGISRLARDTAESSAREEREFFLIACAPL